MTRTVRLGAETYVELRRRRRARLHTPVAHGRARRFYERRGWRAGSLSTWRGLAVLEYRCALRS